MCVCVEGEGLWVAPRLPVDLLLAKPHRPKRLFQNTLVTSKIHLMPKPEIREIPETFEKDLQHRRVYLPVRRKCDAGHEVSRAPHGRLSVVMSTSDDYPPPPVEGLL